MLENIQTLLCGWYIYMAVLGGLMSLSAGRSTGMGRLSALAGLLCLALIGLNWWPLLPVWAVDIGPYAGIDLASLLPHLVVLAVALLALFRAPRTDTRLIGLLLAGASLLPVALFFCHFDGGLRCLP